MRLARITTGAGLAINLAVLLWSWPSWVNAVQATCIAFLAWSWYLLERRHGWLVPPPPPPGFAPRPQGVMITHPDGTATPVELSYLGRDSEEGIEVWGCGTPVRHGDRVTVEKLPARTTITFLHRPKEDA